MTTDDMDRNRTDIANGHAIGNDRLLLPFPPEQGRIGDLGRGVVWSDVVAAIDRRDRIRSGRPQNSAA
jgi:hypothetical protein